MLGNKKIMGQNILRYMTLMGIERKDLAERLNVPYSTLTTWINGDAYPRIDRIEQMARLFKCEKSDLVESRDAAKIRKAVRIPVYGRVRAGIPEAAIEDIIDTEEIDPDMVKDGSEYMALKIHGDSMEPKISDGDVVIVRKQPDVESGQIAIVMVNKNDATCKRVRKYRDGIELVASNPMYEPMFYSNEQIAELPVTIIGRVVELRAKF